MNTASTTCGRLAVDAASVRRSGAISSSAIWQEEFDLRYRDTPEGRTPMVLASDASMLLRRRPGTRRPRRRPSHPQGDSMLPHVRGPTPHTRCVCSIACRRSPSRSSRCWRSASAPTRRFSASSTPCCSGRCRTTSRIVSSGCFTCRRRTRFRAFPASRCRRPTSTTGRRRRILRLDGALPVPSVQPHGQGTRKR